MAPVCPLPASSTDPAFPRALDADLIAALVRDRLGDGSIPVRVAADYVRWKDRDGSIIGWRATVGADALQTYVTVRTAPLERLQDEASKLEHREEDYDGLKSFVLVPEHGLLLVAFPLDRQMSDLRRMVRASKVRTVVQENNPALIPDGMRFSKSKSSWTLVRYKPERRAVIRWDLGFKNDARQSMRTTTWMRVVAEAMPARLALAQAAARCGIRVPQLLAAPHDRLILETHLEGKPWDPCQRAEGAAVAATLARLHGAEQPQGARVHTHSAELELARRAVDDISRLDASLARDASALAARLAQHLPAESPPRLVHGDFHLGQVLVAQDIALCDFDRACLGPAGVDLAALHAHAVIADPDVGTAFSAAFVDDYRRHAAAPSDAELGWWNACALLRTVTSPFRALRANWPAEARRILAAAHTAAAALGHAKVAVASGPHKAADFAAIRAAMPPLDPGTELILRPETDRPLAMLRPSSAPPRTFVMEAGVVRELVPHEDPKLPAAALLGDPERMCRELAPFAGPVSDPMLVAWRPAKRAVVRLRCADGRLVFAKFLDKKTYAKAETTFAGLAEAAAPLHFARPLALLPAWHGYVAAGAPGRSLRDTLAAGGAIPWDLLLRSIASLRAVPPVPDTPVHDFASARKAGSNMLRKASFLDERFAELADRLDALPLPQETSGFVHGDLHDKQIFLYGDAAHLIDLEGVGSGDPNFDLANLAEHLRLRSLQQSGTDDGSADELMRRAGLAPDLQLRWRVLVRARLAGVYALRPRWAQLTERLYSETCNLLSQIP